jgi:hypothetical protein
MAISDTSKIDLLYKKLFGVTKTDTATNKSPSNEAIASPTLIRGDKVWTQASGIPAVAADTPGIVQGYLTTARVECTADTTAAPAHVVAPAIKRGADLPVRTLVADLNPEHSAAWVLQSNRLMAERKIMKGKSRNSETHNFSHWNRYP